MREAAERAIALAPDHAAAHFSRGAALLASAGDFAEGWREYEWAAATAGHRRRHSTGGMAALERRGDAGRPAAAVRRSGSWSVNQFARYIPWVAARCPDLAICCPREMWPILRQFPELRLIVQHWHEAGRCDAFVPLGSLPLLAGTRLDTIPPPVPLRAEPSRAAAWRARLDGLVPAGYRRIGLIWAGNSAHTADQGAQHTVGEFHAVWPRLTVWLWCRCKGPAQAEIGGYFGRAPLFNLGPRMHGLNTMAVLDGIDVLVSVDTGMCTSLARWVTRPGWCCRSRRTGGGCWTVTIRRGLPSVRLFRQLAPRAWAPIMAQVAAALGETSPRSRLTRSAPAIIA